MNENINKLLYTATGNGIPSGGDFVVMTAEDIIKLYDTILVDVYNVIKDGGVGEVLDMLRERYGEFYE